MKTENSRSRAWAAIAVTLVACGGPAAETTSPAGSSPAASSSGESKNAKSASASSGARDGEDGAPEPVPPQPPMAVRSFASEDVHVEYVQFTAPDTPLLRDANAALSKEAMLLASAWKSDHEHWKKTVLREERSRGCTYTSKCDPSDVRVTSSVVSGRCRGAGQCGTGVLPETTPFVGFVFVSSGADGKTQKLTAKDLFVQGAKALPAFQRVCAAVRGPGAPTAAQCEAIGSAAFPSLPFYLRKNHACFELGAVAPTCLPFAAFAEGDLVPAVVLAAKTLPRD